MAVTRKQLDEVRQAAEECATIGILYATTVGLAAREIELVRTTPRETISTPPDDGLLSDDEEAQKAANTMCQSIRNANQARKRLLTALEPTMDFLAKHAVNETEILGRKFLSAMEASAHCVRASRVIENWGDEIPEQQLLSGAKHVQKITPPYDVQYLENQVRRDWQSAVDGLENASGEENFVTLREAVNAFFCAVDGELPESKMLHDTKVDWSKNSIANDLKGKHDVALRGRNGAFLYPIEVMHEVITKRRDDDFDCAKSIRFKELLNQSALHRSCRK